MSYFLFLDDVRERQKVYPDHEVWQVVYRAPDEDISHLKWEVATDYHSFCSIVKEKGLPRFISFDHDLAPDHYTNQSSHIPSSKTGYDCALWLCDFCINQGEPLPQCKVHSQNPVGRRRIEALLESFLHSHIK